jgi:hypothetical protein
MPPSLKVERSKAQSRFLVEHMQVRRLHLDIDRITRLGARKAWHACDKSSRPVRSSQKDFRLPPLLRPRLRFSGPDDEKCSIAFGEPLFFCCTDGYASFLHPGPLR